MLRRPNSSPCLQGGEGSKPMEQQIKQERIWWPGRLENGWKSNGNQ